MPRTITITLTVDDDVDVQVTQSQTPPAHESEVARFFLGFLSDNGRKVYRAAAELDQASAEPYSLEDIAQRLGAPYASIVSMHRSAGRTAKRWERETGRSAPFKLVAQAYVEAPTGDRTVYRLPEGVADEIADL